MGKPWMKAAVGDDTEMVPLQSRVTLELQNVDPLSTIFMKIIKS
jgi:hypothetical protein